MALYDCLTASDSFALPKPGSTRAEEKDSYEFSTLVEDAPAVAAEVLGADDLQTLILEAKAARLALARTADAAPLRAAVGRMEAVLGTHHQQTRKYAEALGAA